MAPAPGCSCGRQPAGESGPGALLPHPRQGASRPPEPGSLLHPDSRVFPLSVIPLSRLRSCLLGYPEKIPPSSIMPLGGGLCPSPQGPGSGSSITRRQGRRGLYSTGNSHRCYPGAFCPACLQSPIYLIFVAISKYIKKNPSWKKLIFLSVHLHIENKINIKKELRY